MLTSGEAAERLGIQEQTLRRWADDGKIPCWRSPGGWRWFRPDELDAFLAGDGADDAKEEAAS